MSQTKLPDPEALLADLIEDPNYNGDYQLNISGDNLSTLLKSVENMSKQNAQMLSALEYVEKQTDSLLNFETWKVIQTAIKNAKGNAE